jgi:hypothetical protein
MLPPELHNYVGEISRVIKKGGTCLITFFLLEPESKELIIAGKSTLDFKYRVDGCLTTDEKVPENALAYEEEFVRDLLAANGLAISEPISYGSWCSRQSYVSYQDIVIATKV